MNEPLSPSALTVIAAYNKEARPEPHHQCEAIAAALRAVADQSENFYDPHEGKVSAIRTDWILAIAAELRAQ